MEGGCHILFISHIIIVISYDKNYIMIIIITNSVSLRRLNSTF